jgi:peptidoglycan/xylan/chitin deacetylase (PgdA/CDA1 family)
MSCTRALLIVSLAAGGFAAGSGTESATALMPAKTQRPRRAPLVLPSALPAKSVRVPILMYHRVARRNDSLPGITRRLTVDPADFQRQMTWLVAHGFRSITHRELFEALFGHRTLPARPVLITFDDGYRNVLTDAAPILDRLGIRATAFVITGRISNGDSSFLTWRQLRALEGLGIEIGSHTVSHPDLRTLGDRALSAELINSRRRLERALEHPVQWLAYPYGGHDARVVAAARRAGYVLASTTLAGSRQDARAPLELRRFSVVDSTGVEGLAGLLGFSGR